MGKPWNRLPCARLRPRASSISRRTLVRAGATAAWTVPLVQLRGSSARVGGLSRRLPGTVLPALRELSATLRSNLGGDHEPAPRCGTAGRDLRTLGPADLALGTPRDSSRVGDPRCTANGAGNPESTSVSQPTKALPSIRALSTSGGRSLRVQSRPTDPDLALGRAVSAEVARWTARTLAALDVRAELMAPRRRATQEAISARRSAGAPASTCHRSTRQLGRLLATSRWRALGRRSLLGALGRLDAAVSVRRLDPR